MMLIPMLIKDNRSKQKFHIARPTCLASGKGLLGVSGACTHQDHMKSPGSQAIQRKSIPSPAPLPPRRQSCPQASPVDTLAAGRCMFTALASRAVHFGSPWWFSVLVFRCCFHVTFCCFGLWVCKRVLIENIRRGDPLRSMVRRDVNSLLGQLHFCKESLKTTLSKDFCP